MEKIIIQFLKAEKFNPRKDYKHATWLALSNTILEDPDYIEYTPLQFKALIYLFCQCSKKKWAPTEIVLKHALKLHDIDDATLMWVVENLQSNGTIQVHERNPKSICTEPERVRSSTNESVRIRSEPESYTNVTDRQTDKKTDTHVQPAAPKLSVVNHPAFTMQARLSVCDDESELVSDYLQQAFKDAVPPRLANRIPELTAQFGSAENFATHLQEILSDDRASPSKPKWRTYVEGCLLRQIEVLK